MDLHKHDLIDTILLLYLKKYSHKCVLMYPTKKLKFEYALQIYPEDSNLNTIPSTLVTIINLCKNKYVAIYLLDDTLFCVSINKTIYNLQDHTVELKKNNITQIGIFDLDGNNISLQNIEHL
jgi:hypothetical protein